MYGSNRNRRSFLVLSMLTYYPQDLPNLSWSPTHSRNEFRYTAHREAREPGRNCFPSISSAVVCPSPFFHHVHGPNGKLENIPLRCWWRTWWWCSTAPTSTSASARTRGAYFALRDVVWLRCDALGRLSRVFDFFSA